MLDLPPTPHGASTSTTPDQMPSPEFQLRRSERVRHPPGYLSNYQLYAAITSLHEPSAYREAKSNPLWQQAMTEELQALLKAKTWDLVDLPPGKSCDRM